MAYGSIDSYAHIKKVWHDIYEKHRSDPEADVIIYRKQGASSLGKLQQDLNYYRVKLRKLNSELHPKGHPSHGTCIFDQFAVTIVKDKAGEQVLRIRKKAAEGFEISISPREAQ